MLKTSKLLFWILSILFVSSLWAFEGSEGTISISKGLIGGDLTIDNAQGGTYSVDLVISPYPTSQGAGGTTDANTGVLYEGSWPPIVDINFPQNNYSTQNTNITMTYSGIDFDGDLNAYYVKLDSGNWVNNGLNTSYSFNNLSTGSHTLYLKADDSMGLESKIKSVNIMIISSGTPGTSSERRYGSGVSEHYDIIQNKIVVEALKPCQTCEIPKQLIPINKEKLKIIKITEITLLVRNLKKAIKADLKITINVKNISNEKINSITIRDNIDKSLAETADKIKFEQAPKIIKKDPLVEWKIAELEPGQDINFIYYIEKITNKDVLEPDIIEYLKQLDVPVGLERKIEKTNYTCQKSCDDGNPCTEDYCIQNKCFHKQICGAYCGQDAICNKGQCQKIEKKQITKSFILPQHLIPLIMILALAVFFLIIKQKKHKEKMRKRAIELAQEAMLKRKKKEVEKIKKQKIMQQIINKKESKKPRKQIKKMKEKQKIEKKPKSTKKKNTKKRKTRKKIEKTKTKKKLQKRPIRRIKRR